MRVRMAPVSVHVELRHALYRLIMGARDLFRARERLM